MEIALVAINPMLKTSVPTKAAAARAAISLEISFAVAIGLLRTNLRGNRPLAHRRGAVLHGHGRLNVPVGQGSVLNARLGFTRPRDEPDLGMAHRPYVAGNLDATSTFKFLQSGLHAGKREVREPGVEVVKQFANDHCNLLDASRALAKEHGVHCGRLGR